MDSTWPTCQSLAVVGRPVYISGRIFGILHRRFPYSCQRWRVSSLFTGRVCKFVNSQISRPSHFIRGIRGGHIVTHIIAFKLSSQFSSTVEEDLQSGSRFSRLGNPTQAVCLAREASLKSSTSFVCCCGRGTAPVLSKKKKKKDGSTRDGKDDRNLLVYKTNADLNSMSKISFSLHANK